MNPEFIVEQIMKLAREHKEETCKGVECNISLFPLRYAIKAIAGREPTDAEKEVLS